MDDMDGELADAAINSNYSPAVRAAVTLAKKTLNRYYDKTDNTEIYRISMGKCDHSLSYIHLTDRTLALHPQYKLEYFTDAGWEEEWIDTAKSIVREQYDRAYAQREVSSAFATASAPVAEAAPASAPKVRNYYFSVSQCL